VRVARWVALSVGYASILQTHNVSDFASVSHYALLRTQTEQAE